MREETNPGRDVLKMSVKMNYFGIFSAALFMLLLTFFMSGCAKDEVKPLAETDPLKAVGIVELSPANLADSVAVNPIVTVTFESGTSKSAISASSITLNQGSTVIPGTLTFTDNSVAFSTEADLSPDKEYKATVKTTAKGSSDSGKEKEYAWRFKTGRHHRDEGLSVISVIPLNSAKDVTLTIQPVASFNKEISSSMMKSTTFVLQHGTMHTEGSVSFSGNTATFKPSASLIANTVYTGKVNIQTTGHDNHSSNHYYIWSFTTAGGGNDVTAPTVASVLPASNATAVPVTNKLTAVFSEIMNTSTINSTTFTLKQGTAVIAGTVGCSGNTATFTPSVSLATNSIYSATITTGAKDVAGNAIASNFSWNFTTGALTTDVTPPSVLSVFPLNSATSVAVSSKPAVTFSEAMNASTITSSTLTLKQGTTSIAGTVSYTGTTATFSPSANLANNTAYTVTVTTGAKDAAGNAIASTFTSGFTTAAAADVTPPSVTSAVPANGSVSIAVNSKVTATFSEAMSASTISSSSFTVKQGTTSVGGSVTYTGTTATFTPSSDLTGNTVYTATITTAARDAAGNALTSNYTWSFTTVAVTTGLSFASDVLPALNVCNSCHVHNWTTSTVASTFYANLVSAGYVNAASYTTSKLYTKINGGHPSSTKSADMTKILTWMSEGSKNN